LSHNSKGKPAARALAARLRDAGVSVWLDEEQLRPGEEWQPGLRSGIRASKSIAVLIGVAGMGPWQDQEVQFAFTLAVRDRRPVIPVLLPGAPHASDLPQGLVIRTWVDLRRGEDGDNQGGLDRLIWGIKGVKPRQAVTSDPTKPPQSPSAAPGRAPVIDAHTWDRAHLVLRDLLVGLPGWEMIQDRRAFVKAALDEPPKEQKERIDAGRDWLVGAMTPSFHANAFLTLVTSADACNPRAGLVPAAEAPRLRKEPEQFPDFLKRLLAARPAWLLILDQAFIEAADYGDAAWWDPSTSEEAYRWRWDQPNRPRVAVDWFEAMAFCRWLTARCHEARLIGADQLIRLPTEQEDRRAGKR
jgi:hypothetical protein